MTSPVEKDFIVTPWEVSGDIDYSELIRRFGTEPLTDALVKRIESKAGFSHTLLRRRLFFSHRDLGFILDKYDKGEKFALYTGRGPSGDTHLGHLVPWIFTKYLQDAFDVELYFQMTDDEKYLVKDLTLDETRNYAYENALDVIACGFKPKKTFIFADTEYIKTMYPISVQVAKKVTFSQAKAVFGFTNESNIGLIFFPSIQAAPCFLPSVLKKKNVPVLIPAAIDQDPYWRGIAREVAPKLGYYKPAQIHCRFLPGLGEGGKMSASDSKTAIFTTDKSADVRKKVAGAFTGGQATVQEQKEKGGNPSICTVFQYFHYLFEEDDKKIGELQAKCRGGGVMCGECKKLLTERVNNFLGKHQAAREKARDKIGDYMLKD